MGIKLDFTSLEPYRGIYDNPNFSFFVFVGSRGSGKTTEVVFWILTEILTKGGDFLVLRKKKDKTQFSVHKEFADTILRHDLGNFFKIKGNEILLVRSRQRGRIVFEGASSPTDLKSYSGFKTIWLEEADQFSSEDIEVLSPTIRKENAKLFLTSNFVSKRHWMAKKFLQVEDEKVCVVKTTFRDNPHLPSDWLPNQERAFRGNKLAFRMQVLGEELNFDLNKLFPNIEISTEKMKSDFVFSVVAKSGNNLATLTVGMSEDKKILQIISSASFSILESEIFRKTFSELETHVYLEEKESDLASVLCNRFGRFANRRDKIHLENIPSINQIWEINILEHEGFQNLKDSLNDAEFLTVDEIGQEQKNLLTRDNLFVDAVRLALSLVSRGVE